MGSKLKIPSFHSPNVQSQPDAGLKTMISKGKGAMPSFSGKLTDSQIDQMVIYVRALGK
jgi:mono/diheme cytochrome c family protein